VSAAAVFAIGIIVSALVTAAGIYAVAIRRGPSAGVAATAGERREQRTSKRDQVTPRSD